MSEQTIHAPESEQEQPEYRDIPGCPGYRAGSDGSIWSRRVRGGRGGIGTIWRRLAQVRTGPENRKYVTLPISGRFTMRYVHYFILLAFVGPRPDGMESCHNDGDRDNNRASNLRWDTPANNNRDKVRHGTHNRGSRHNLAKLTEDDVRLIRTAIAERTARAVDLAKRFHVSQAMISMIVNRKNWQHI